MIDEPMMRSRHIDEEKDDHLPFRLRNVCLSPSSSSSSRIELHSICSVILILVLVFDEPGNRRF